MQRKKLIQKRSELEGFIQRHESFETDLTEYLGADYSEYHPKLQIALQKLNEDLKKLPTGHRYSGTFYIRKPNNAPVISEKIDGSAYLREDLVKWKREIEGKEAWEQPYYKAIFKDPDMRVPINRADSYPVFD